MRTPTKLQALFLSLLVAFVGLGTYLGVTVPLGEPVVGPDPTVPTPTETAPPPPSPTPDAVTTSPRVKFRVAVWNEKSNPHLTADQYRHDLLSEDTSGWVRADSLAYLGSEFNTGSGVQQRALRWARRHGWEARTGSDETPEYPNDVFEMFQPRDDLTLYATHAAVFHDKAPGPASPQRRYVATWADVGGFKVVFVSLHLTNGCFPGNKGKWWYEARCQAVQDEVTWLRRHVVRHERRNGWSVVIGGDLNTNEPVQWHKSQQATKPLHLMQLAVVPAGRVNASLDRVRTLPAEHPSTGLYTDHPVVSARLTLSKG